MLRQVDKLATLVNGRDTLRTSVHTQITRIGRWSNGVDSLFLATLHGKRRLRVLVISLAGLNHIATLLQLRVPQATGHTLALEEDVGIVVYQHTDVTIQVRHILHVHIDRQRLLVGRDILLDGTLNLSVDGLDDVLTIVQVLIIYRCGAYILVVDIHLRLSHWRSNRGIDTCTDIQQHLVGLGTCHGNRIGVVTQHAKGSMRDGQTLGTTRHVKPYLARFLLNGNNTQGATIKGESRLRGYYLNQCCGLSILVSLGGTIAIRC